MKSDKIQKKHTFVKYFVTMSILFLMLSGTVMIQGTVTGIVNEQGKVFENINLKKINTEIDGVVDPDSLNKNSQPVTQGTINIEKKLGDVFGRKRIRNIQKDFEPKKTPPKTIPEFPSYAVPVIAMLGIFLILGSRKND